VKRRRRALFAVVAGAVLPAVAWLACGGSEPGPSTPTSFDHFVATGSYQGEYWPTDDWRTCRPEDVGMDSASLYTAYEYAARSSFVTEGILVVRRGYVVGEEYFRGYGPATRFASYSVAKSFLSAVVGVAIERGHIPGVEQLAYPYFDAWKAPGTDERKRAITVRHLLTMQSGLRFTDASGAGWAGTDIEGILNADDAVAYVLGLPSVAEPGARWNYSSGDSILLSGILQAATGRTALEFGRERIFGRIGMSTMTWSSDRAGHTIGGWGIGATLREYARFGYLYLRNGWWNGEALVPEPWIRQSLTAARPSVPGYGFQWWLAPSFATNAQYPVPGDTFAAQGLYHQKILVVPSRDLVVVRVGTDQGPSSWSDTEFLGRILASIRG
jgi:CubicO group peptidase (beta-lactamase class C family)